MSHDTYLTLQNLMYTTSVTYYFISQGIEFGTHASLICTSLHLLGATRRKMFFFQPHVICNFSVNWFCVIIVISSIYITQLLIFKKCAV